MALIRRPVILSLCHNAVISMGDGFQSGRTGTSAPVAMASSIIAEASLSFLGVGVPPEIPTWGTMLADARIYISTAWWLPLFPGLCIFVTVLGINLLGDALHLDERVRRMGIIDTHHHTWITCQRTAFRGDLAGVERQFAVVDDEPNWCHKGAAVGSEITEQSRAGAFG